MFALSLKELCEFLKDAPVMSSISNALLSLVVFTPVNTPGSQAPGLCWVFALPVGSLGGSILRQALPGQRKNSRSIVHASEWSAHSQGGHCS